MQEPLGWHEVAPTCGAVSRASGMNRRRAVGPGRTRRRFCAPAQLLRLWFSLPRQRFWVLGRGFCSGGMKTATAEETLQFVSDRRVDPGPGCPPAARLSPSQSHATEVKSCGGTTRHEATAPLLCRLQFGLMVIPTCPWPLYAHAVVLNPSDAAQGQGALNGLQHRPNLRRAARGSALGQGDGPGGPL